MFKPNLSKQVKKKLRSLPAKHAKQIAAKIVRLADDPGSLATQELKGYPPFRRAMSGEYRIIYFIEQDILHVTLIGKRNDDEIYRMVGRFLKS